MKKIALLIICTATSYSSFAIDPITGPSAVCTGSTITLADATPGGTWSTSSPATGTISTSGVLTGIAAGALTVTYTVGGPYVTMDVTVNPTGTLVSTLTPPAICDSTWFDYTPVLSLPGATASWGRPFVGGVSSLPATGSGPVHEILNNITSFPVTITYVYTVTAGACSSVSTVTVNVNPTPRLINPMPAPICDSTLFSFAPASLTLGTTYNWVRPFVVGIPMPSGAGTGNVSETLDNATNSVVTVTYVYTLMANGCTNTQNVPVTVNPTPHLSSPLEDSVCSGKNFIYLPESDAVAPVAFKWSRAVVTGITNPAASGVSGIDEILMNSTTGPLHVVYTYTLTVAPGCTNIQEVDLKVNVGGPCEMGFTERAVSTPSISVFPNPAATLFHVVCNSAAGSEANLVVTDILGRPVFSTTLKSGDEAKVAPGAGIYVVSVSGSSGSHVVRVVVE